MTDICGFYWLETEILAGSAYPGNCLNWLYYQQGIRALVSLQSLKPKDREKALALGFQITDVSITDYTAGSPKQRKQALQAIDQYLQAGIPVLVHCEGGLGRTGMVLAIYLVQRKELTPQSAIHHIRSLRKGSIEPDTGQEEAILASKNKD